MSKKTEQPKMCVFDVDVLLCAVRYALPRHSYVVHSVTSAIKMNILNIDRTSAKTMVKDIDDTPDRLGDEWAEVRDMLYEKAWS